MKDLGATKQVVGMSIARNKKTGSLKLFQHQEVLWNSAWPTLSQKLDVCNGLHRPDISQVMRVVSRFMSNSGQGTLRKSKLVALLLEIYFRCHPHSHEERGCH